MTAPAEFERGIGEFNQQEFYACHDTLEAIWVDAPETDKRFYQGILQVAVGCYHLSNGNLRGAIILLGEALRRLTDYQPDYLGVDVERLIEQAATLMQALQQLKLEQTLDFFQLLQQKAAANAELSSTNAPEDLQQLLIDCQIPYIHRA